MDVTTRVSAYTEPEIRETLAKFESGKHESLREREIYSILDYSLSLFRNALANLRPRKEPDPLQRRGEDSDTMTLTIDEHWVPRIAGVDSTNWPKKYGTLVLSCLRASLQHTQTFDRLERIGSIAFGNVMRRSKVFGHARSKAPGTRRRPWRR